MDLLGRAARSSLARIAFLIAVVIAPLAAIAGDAQPVGATLIPIMSQSRLSASQLVAWFKTSTGSPYRATVPVEALASYYIVEGQRAGVRGDIAFAQSVLETAWFSFPDAGYIRAGYNNFAGIGAWGPNLPCGVQTSNVKCWATAQLGVRAQMQLLRRYADPNSNQYNIGSTPVPELWNPASNYDYPGGTHGWAPSWQSLSGTWASSTTYATVILGLYSSVLTSSGLPVEPPGNGAPPTWKGWESLGGAIVGAPDVAAWGPGRLDAFVRGVDDQLYHRFFDGSSWSGWEALGGRLTSDPTVTSSGPNRLDVFVRGTDNQLYRLFWDGVAWSGWGALGGDLAGGADAASWGPNRLDVFARGTGDVLTHTYWNGTQWSEWETLGGPLTSDPSAAASPPGDLEVYGRGPQGQLQRMSWNSVLWSGWQLLDGGLIGGPDASTWRDARLDVFVNGTDNALYWTSWQGTTRTGWKSLGGTLTSDPGAASWAPGRIDVFVRGTDGQMYHKYFN